MKAALQISVALLLSCWQALGCAPSERAPTQLLVTVSAEPSVAARLQRVRAVVAPSGTRALTGKERTHEFSLVAGQKRGVQVTLPFSFGVARGSSRSVLLVVEGFDRSGTDAVSFVEHKLVASFESGVARSVNVLLTDACLDKACKSLQATCAAESMASCVGLQNEWSFDAGTGTPEADAGGPRTAISEDGIVATPEDAGMLDASLPQSTPPERSQRNEPDDADSGAESDVCDRPNACTADYPCVGNVTGGYTCRGQFADWPMPDTAAGAKVAPSYDYRAVEGVVIDLVTKLEWQRDTPPSYAGCSGRTQTQGDGCLWSEAKSYCRQLDLAGGGWRLPTKIELESLIGDSKQVPAIDSAAFPNASVSDQFWTASPAVGQLDGLAWTVFSGLGLSNPDDPAMPLDVRCVRGGAIASGTPNDRYRLDAAAESATDVHTTLEWQVKFGDVDSIEAAREYCSKQGGGWRLPGLNELFTLIDPLRSEPAIDSVFPAIPIGGMFWTNTPMGLSEDAPQYVCVAFAAGLAGGSEDLRDIEDQVRFTFHARCVR